jgi:hypothetical protein
MIIVTVFAPEINQRMDPNSKIYTRVHHMVKPARRQPASKGNGPQPQSQSPFPQYAVRSYHINVDQTFDMVTGNFKKVLPGHRPIWTFPTTDASRHSSGPFQRSGKRQPLVARHQGGHCHSRPSKHAILQLRRHRGKLGILPLLASRPHRKHYQNLWPRWLGREWQCPP